MLERVKKRKKQLLHSLVAFLVFGVGFSTFAQLTSDAYTVRTVHIFPSQIEANGWENAETLTFQNLDEYALLQDFNAINSATLGTVRDGKSVEIDTPPIPVEEPAEETVASSSDPVNSEADTAATTTATEVVESEEPTATTTEQIDPTQEAEETVEESEEPAQDPISPGSEAATEEVGADETAEEPQAEEVSDTADEEVEGPEESAEAIEESATTTVLREVRSLFRLAIDTVTEAIATSSESDEEVETEVEPSTPEEVPEAVATEDVTFGFVDDSEAESSVPPVSVETTTSTEEESVIDVDAATTSDAVATTTSETDVSTSTEAEAVFDEELTEDAGGGQEVAATTTEPIGCDDDCAGHVLRLGNFGFPIEDGVELSGAQLRMSFAALQRETREELSSLTMNYSFDGGDSWSTGGSVVIEDEVSNSINGGYYLFALPTITDSSKLASLQVELRFDDNPDLVSELYIDAVWLELFVLEPPAEQVAPEFAELLADDGYDNTNLAGDILVVSETEEIEFTFTDDNTDETLIIKSDQKTYEGLSEATTYFSVTNTSGETDDFSVQTYFPQGVGEVTDLQVFNLNKPRQAIIPEYRPYVYHCEAGWELGGEVELSTTDIAELSAELTASSTEDVASSSEEVLLEVSTTTADVVEPEEVADEAPQYSCRQTSVVRSCESLDGDGTACVVTQKVSDHEVTRYAPGWDNVETEAGTQGQGNLLERAASFFGFGPDRKEVPDSFEGRVHTDQVFSIDPGETKYFKMDIAFPPFSRGEYWIEVVGDHEYGLLDPFWSSDWQYRMPISIDNPTGVDQTEYQVRLQLDSAIADFWANIQADGDDIRFVQETTTGNLVGEPGPVLDNTYDLDWQGRVAITIPAVNVDSTLSDFPVYVDLSTLGPDFWAGVQSDGRDIRVTRANGSTEVPHELVWIDGGTDTGELHFKAPILDSSTDNTFHIYYDNPSATAYGPTDTYGSQNVWTNGYEAVYHFQGGGAAGRNNAAQYTDSTANGYDAEDDTVVTDDTGLFGDGVGFDPANGVSGTDTFDHLNIDPNIIDSQSQYTVTTWYQASSSGIGGLDHTFVSGFGGENEIIIRVENGTLMEQFTNGAAQQAGQVAIPSIQDDTWHHFAYTFADDSAGDFAGQFFDGAEVFTDTNVSGATITINPNGLIVGGEQDGAVDATTGVNEGLDGFIDSLRFANVVRSDDWISAEYDNQNTPGTFYSTSTTAIDNSAGVDWYSTSWNGRQLFTIEGDEVVGDQTDFPVYLDLSILGSDFFSQVASDGRDIRITQGDAVTELPHELVAIDTGAETGELYFKTNLTAGVDTDFYIYFDNEDAIAYARDDTYGTENVWTNNFRVVYHFEEDEAGINNPDVYKDSTANQYDADDGTSDTDTTGRLGQGVGFGAGVNDVVEPPNEILDGLSDHTVSWWHNTTQTSDLSIISGANASQQNEFLMFFNTTTNFQAYYNGPAESFGLADTVGSFNTGLWQQFMVTGEDAIDEVNLYVNGQGDTENPDPQAMTTFSIPNGGVVIGQEQDAVNGSYDPNQRMIGQLDELRIAEVVRSADWAATEYTNIDNPTTFFATSSVEMLQVTEFVELDYWLQHFDNTTDEADIWVQIEDLPAEGTTIYAYYGNPSATAGSDELATFSYDTLTEVYFVVDDHGADSIEVTSLIDNNQVQLDGGTVIDLNRGETTSIASPDGSDGLSILGPVSAIVAGASSDSSDMVVPISFATTTFAVPTNRNTNVWYAYAPFASTTVRVFEGASATALATANVQQDTASTLNAAITVSNSGTDGAGAIVEASDPVLLTHRVTNPGDGLVAYPPTTEAIYGINSNFMHFSGVNASTNVTLTCSTGAGGTLTGITRGDHEADASCTAAAEGAGSAVRVSGATGPVTAVQQADSDGNETTVFWPEIEFGTQYALPRSGAYVAVVCAPRYGSVDLEMQDALGNTIESATCTPGVTTPGKAYFTNGTSNGDTANFSAGSMVVSTNETPFYAIFEDVGDDQDEKNIQAPVQARKFGGNTVTFLTGDQEEANAPEWEQLSFAWYETINDLTPTSTWPLGDESVTEGQVIDGVGAVNTGDILRLRMNAAVSNATATVDRYAFKLQYAIADNGQCSVATAWNDVGQIGSTTAAFTGYNAPDIQDGTALATTTLASSTVAATYEERNLSDFIRSEVGVGGVAEWDWHIEVGQVSVNTNYCFRMVQAEGNEFQTYTLYPEAETVGPPNTPTPIAFFDNENTNSLTPILRFAATDIAGDDIQYEIEIDDDVNFGSVDLTRNSTSNFLEFENVNQPADKAPFTSGAEVRFTGTTDLSATTTYWWRVRASDPGGAATSSDWSTPFSFTTDTTVTVSEWLQTTTDQFETNTLSGVTASGDDIDLSTAAGSVISTPIDFDDATVGNAWGEVIWNETETSGTLDIQVQFNDSGTWKLVPDSLISGNSTGVATSPINLLDLDTSTYNEIRLVAILAGTTVSLQDWKVRWGQRVETPVLGDLFDNQKTADTLPIFDLFSSDPQGDDLQYEISFSTDINFVTSSSTFDSAADPGFANPSDGGDTSPFNSGDTITYTTQPGDAFTNGETYWWRARAKDPLGGDAFSPWSEPDSFTINTGTTLSTWFQTTQEQFFQGELNGVVASTTDSVEVSNNTGEYGTTTVTNGVWTEITTQLTYNSPVVVASVQYDRGSEAQRFTRIRNKESNSFEVRADNYNNTAVGTTVVNYVVMEEGDYTIEGGERVVAGTFSDVSAVENRSLSTNPGGPSVTFSPSFSGPPAVFTSITTDNDTDWVVSSVYSGTNKNNQPSASELRVFQNLMYAPSAVHGDEDIDYIAIDTGHGTNNGSEYDAANSSSNNVTDAVTAVNFTSAFTSAPEFTLVQNITNAGGDGGFTVRDTGTPPSTTQVFVAIDEGGNDGVVNADRGHGAAERVAVWSFEDSTGLIARDSGSGLDGTIAGEDIIFSDGAGPKFDNFSWVDTTPGTSDITVQMQYRVSEGVYALIPDGSLPGNSTGFTSSPIDLTTVDINVYDQIRPLAALNCGGADCPSLDEWQLEWSEGVNMSGTLQEYDRSTNVATGTIRAAVNGTPVSGSGTVTAGVWTLNNVTAFAGDIVTVWVDGAEESEEAVTAFIYDGLGDIMDVKLYEQHLAFDADEFGGDITNSLLSSYDNSVSGDEDIFFDVDGFNNLTVCSVGVCPDANMYVAPGQTYIPATSTAATISTHDFINEGTIELDANTFNVSGSWDNSATSSTDTSTINFTAASGSETITSTEDPLTFHNVSFGGFGMATFTPSVGLDLSGDLTVATGTFDRGTNDLTVGGSIATDFGGVWAGTGTTTFDGSGAKTWSDTNTVPQNIGNVTIDGPSTIVTVTSDVAAYDVVIGGNDTLVGGSGNTIYVGGDWNNNGTFTPDTSTVEIIEDDRIYPPIVPGSADWYSDVAFVDRVPVTIDNSEVNGPLSDFPIYLDLSTLGADFWSDVTSDGRDIRITAGDGQTELPHDLVEIDTVAETGELHFLADSVSDSSDTTFYVYFNNVSATAYAATDTYGRNATWNGYKAVYHFTDDPSTIGNTVTDATGNGFDLTVTNAGLSTTSGQIGTGYDLVGVSGALTDSDFFWTAGERLITSGWYFMTVQDNSAYYEWGTGADPNNIEYRPWSGATTGVYDFGDSEGFNINPRDNTTWHHFFLQGATSTAQTNAIYEDAIIIETPAQTVNNPQNTVDGLQIGRFGTTNYYDGEIDEFRVATTVRNTDWIEAEYSNQNTPTIFYSTSSVEAYQPPVVIDEATHNIIGGGSAFYNLVLNDASTTPAFIDPSLIVNCDFTVATGTVALPTGKLNVGCNFTNNGVFMHNNGEVEFDGSGSHTITLNGTEFLNGFFDVTFDGTGDWTFLDTNATTSNDVVINNGTVNFPSGVLTIGGTLDTNSGGFTGGTGTVMFISEDGENITTNGSSFNDAIFGLAGDFDWYNTLWTGRERITIPASNINATLTDFPVYVDLSDLGNDFWSGVATDGSDIRITNSDGQTELPYELVSINTVSETGQLHFKADSISDSADTTFYVYYDNATAAAYSATSTYGRNNVWTNGYEAVYHLEETGAGTLDEYIDSTGNGYDGQGGQGVVTDVPALATGQLGNAQDFENTAPEDHIELDATLSTAMAGTGAKSVSAWANVETFSDNGGVWGLGANQTGEDFTMRVRNGTGLWRAQHNGTPDHDFTYGSEGIWYHMVLDYDGVTSRAYADGGLRSSEASSLNTTDDSGYGVQIGRWRNAEYFDGIVDEVRFSSVSRDLEWYEAEHLNQSDTATFYSVASETLAGDAQIFTLNEDFTDVAGDLTIQGSQLVAPLNTLTIGGSAFNNSGAFNANNATTTFDSTDLGEVVALGSAPFYNLSFNGVGGGWTVATNTVQNKATLVTGASYLQSPNTTLTVQGVFENSFNAAATTWTDSTLLLTGGDYEVTGRLDSGDDYANVEVSGDTDIIIWNSTIASSTINDTSSIYMPDYGGIDGLLRIYGDFDRATSSEYWSYATDFDGTDLTGGSERAVSVEIADGSLITIASTSAIVADGTTATTTVSAISGSYSLIADGATIDMTGFSITDTDTSGFQLRNGAIITQLTVGEFLIATGTAITVDAATIEAQPSTSYSDIRFQAVSGTPSNVTLEGIPAGYWLFAAGTGDRYGESFDNDDGDPGAIQWDDSSFTIDVSGVVYDDDGMTPTSAPVCNGTTNVVNVAVDGVFAGSAPCDPFDGSYTVSGVAYVGNPKITTYIERSAADGTVVPGIMDERSGVGVSSPITIDVPDTVDGSVLVAIIGKDDEVAVTPPVGWTAISTFGNTTGDQIFNGAWYRVVSDASSEPATYDFVADGGEGYSYWVGSLVNVDTASPVDVSNGWNKLANDTTPASPAVTTTVANTVVVSAWYVDNDATVDIPNPTDWVTHVEGLASADNNNLGVISTTYDSIVTTDSFEAIGLAGGRDPQVITMAFAPATSPSATGTMTAAVVTQTPIGSTGNAFEDISLTDETTGAATVVSGGNIPVTVPTTADNDVLIAVIGKEDDFDITPPVGWTLIADLADASGNDIYAGAWYRVVTDATSEPVSYNFVNNDTGTEEYAYWIGSYANVDISSPIDVPVSWVKRVDDATPAAASITTVTDKTQLIAAWMVVAEADVNMPIAPWETRVEDLQSGTSQRTLAVASRVQALAGATGDVDLTSLGGGDETNSIQIALRPRLVSVADEIADMDLYQNRVIVRHEDITPLTIADMVAFDNDDEDDLPFTASTVSTPDNLTVLDGAGLYVWDNKTFAPGGEIDLQGTGATAADGSLAVGPAATLTLNNTDPLTIGGSLFVDTAGTFNGATSTVTFDSANAGQQIAAAGSSTINFYDLAFTGAGDWAVQTPIVVDQDIAASAGTIVGVSDITVVNGDFAGNGLVAMTGGTTQLNTNSVLGGANPWTFFNLDLGDGATGGITTTGSNATTTVTNRLTIDSGHFLDAFGSVWDLAGSGSAFVENGTFLEGTSTVRYSGATPNVLRTTYNNLVIDTDGAGSVVATAPSIGLQILGDLTVGALGTSTLDITTSDPLTAVGGSVYIGALGTIDASDNSALNVFGSWDNDGTFIANGGLVEFLQATGTATIAAGNSDFADLTIAGNTDYTVTESATSTGSLIIGTSQFTMQSGEVLASGGTFRNNMTDPNTTWTGSTLRLYGGNTYTINAQLTSDTYDTLVVTGNTQPRVWNSSATTITTDPGSSLYSMDHADVPGELNIYGDFVSNLFTDHWSYETDFDGTALGAPRQVNVQIEDGGSVLYTGGSLSVVGSSTASTSIAALGSGPYTMTLGGTTTVTMDHYTVREQSAEGLVLTSSPTVGDLSRGDISVAIAGGSALTVGGTVISANPAKNFTDNRFATTTAINAFNVTATGTSVSSWRFVNVDGNLDGEAKDVDPGGDPGYVVWQDSAAIIDISGNVYQNNRTLASAVCDGVTNNIRLSIGGLTFASTSCAAGTGAYTFTGIGFGPSDTLTVYIDGEATQAATVTKDPISLIGDMDLYENHVIVRHESGAPQTIAAMAVYDSSDDADIPFTAVDAVTDTLTLPSDFTLLVWNNKDFEPGGDVTISGGGAGASFDGSLELFAGADYIASSTETHSIGGNVVTAGGSLIAPSQSTFAFTSSAAARTLDFNEAMLYNATFSGSGSWTITDPTFTATNDTLITGGAVTLPTGTSTIGGSFDNTGGSFVANNGVLYFTAQDAGNTIEFGGSDAHVVLFAGDGGTWAFTDTNATSTDSFTVATGTVTLPAGTLTVSGDFIVTDTVAHNGGVVSVIGTGGGNVVTLNGNDLSSLRISAPAGDYTLTDPSAAFLGDITLTDGTFSVGTGTVSIGGSFDVSGGTYNNGSGTLLFNSADGGEFIDPGTNDLYNVVVAGAGGWSLAGSATTTNNFSLTNAGTFTATPGSVLYVGGVFTNTVGGAATTWADTTLVLDGGNEYETNVKATAAEVYGTVMLGANTDISMWNSSAATTTVPGTSSLYSQDNAGVDGDLYIYGDYQIGTTTEYWSASTDFDGAVLGSPRQANVYVASSSAVTLSGGTLEIIGTASASTSIQNQGTGLFDFAATAGTLNANNYNVSNITANGLDISGTTVVSSLSNGYFTQSANGTNLITVVSAVISNNSGLTIADTGFATGGFTGGVNVSLDATTTSSWNFTGALGDLWGEAFDVDGVDACSSIRWDDSDCLLTEQTNYRWRNDDGGEGAPDSTWFDTDWSSRQRVRVINEDTTAYASTAVQFVVPFDADMQSDFEDLRFTAADGTTLINHWIERFVSGSEANVWIQAPTLAADSVNEFYMYYGNVSATSTSDGSAVFSVIEDFEDDDLSEYSGGTGDLARFETGSTFAFGGGFGLDAADPNERTNDGIIRDDITVAQGQNIRFMQYIDTVAGSGDEVCTLFAVNGLVTANDNYAICIDQFGVDRISIVEGVQNTEFSGTILASSTADFATAGSGWYEFLIDWETDDTIDVSVFDPTGDLLATTTATDSSNSSGGIGFAFWFQNGGWDSFVSWPRTETLPTVYLGDEQADGGATWANAQNTPTGGFAFGETARLRVGIENSGLDIENQRFQLEFAPKLTAPTCEAVPAVNYTAVPNVASCGGSAVCMATSLNVSDGDTTTDHLVTAAGDFAAGAVVTSPNNRTALYDLNQDRYTELEYALQLTVNAVNDAYCFRVTNDGTGLDSYSNLPELTLAFDPVITGVTLNDGADIVLTPGSTTTIIASSTVTDFNGVGDLVSATTTFYKTSVGAACTPDDNNCYVATSSCSFVNCSGNSCSLLCEAPFAYHTDPTDTDGMNEWFAFMEVGDSTGATDFDTSLGVDVLTLRALDVQNAIAYGTVDINENTGLFNPSVNLVNLGNEPIDVRVAGTDMTDGVTSVIPATQQLYSTSTFDYAACIGCSALSVTGADLEVDLNKPLASTPVVSDDIYWGIEVPFGTASAPHTGVNFFTAISD